jgi:catechol 2,3-dioxygenase-like lactoylglutathione lyase family enzyme
MPRFTDVSPRLPVADLKRTIEFYRGRLGFALGGCWPEQAPTFAILERDGVRIQFFVPEDEMAAGQAMLSFDVEDARALHSSLAGRVAIIWGPEVYWYGRREFAIHDPDGYMVIISEPIAGATSHNIARRLAQPSQSGPIRARVRWRLSRFSSRERSHLVSLRDSGSAFSISSAWSDDGHVWNCRRIRFDARTARVRPGSAPRDDRSDRTSRTG